jgi:hypothetical protein
VILALNNQGCFLMNICRSLGKRHFSKASPNYYLVELYYVSFDRAVPL